MIVPQDINQNDIVKVLVNDDGIEEEMYGVVGMNTGNVLGVRYLSQTNKIYKSACVLEIEKGELSPVSYESLTEHHASGTTFCDLEMKFLGNNMYAYLEEIDIEDDDSEIYEDLSESETDSEMNDFIVPDENVNEMPLPDDYNNIDKEWNEWSPSTPGAKSFKNTVDMIEMHTKRLRSEMEF